MAVERKIYVSMTDTFLSGWGEAKDKIPSPTFGPIFEIEVNNSNIFNSSLS